ncbi:MAG: YlmH/Sll1252 family protein [Eubacterium sp.]
MDEKRFNELYDRAYERKCKVFSDFLNLEEQSILKESFLPCTVFGGYETAERVVAGFGEDVAESDFPISCLLISPASKKFADSLTHRDFLGALMNLGIKREMLGDIVVEENCGYLFCLEQIKDYILENLIKVKHTSVNVTVAENLPEDFGSSVEERELVVSSLRVDVLVSAVYKLSRKEASKLFETDKIFVNSRKIQSSSYIIKENDIVSVRGFGRFIFGGELHRTKKDRLVVSVQKFV